MVPLSAGTPLGDPIEVGALGFALAAGGKSSSSERLLALGSSKSCCGHTEGTAGLTGALLAAVSLAQQQLPPVVNLRSINPYVLAAFDEWRRRQGLAAAPSRQLGAAGCLTTPAAQHLAGTSAFGMSGVNAHALLSSPANVIMDSSGTRNGWQRAKVWPSTIPHPLLIAAFVGHGAVVGSRTVVCAADVGLAGLGWLRDHKVQGKLLLPATAVFELGAATAAACLPVEGTPAGSSTAALTGLAVLAPYALPAASATSMVLLNCHVEASSGILRITSSTGSAHMQGAVALVLGKQQQLHQGIGIAAASTTAAAVLLPHTVRCSQGHNFAGVDAGRQQSAG